jgi:phosphoglycerate dehydrogenase-like enzyme
MGHPELPQQMRSLEARKRHIGAGHGVHEREPVLDADYSLFKMDNIGCTAHIGYVTREGYEIHFSPFDP